MKVLVDSDPICYQVAYSKEPENISDLLNKTDSLVESIVQKINPYMTPDDLRFYLTGKGNFRYDIDPLYKSTRVGEKPKSLQLIKQHFINKYNATLSENEEADDMIAIEASKHKHTEVVVVSIDKDFRQIPCQLYNPGRDTWESIDPWSGLVNFYEQLLVGDPVDSVVGIYKVGPVKAKKILEAIDNEKGLWDKCVETYNDYDRCLSNARMLWLRRYEGEIWKPPK